jgi:hypothetical protein
MVIQSQAVCGLDPSANRDRDSLPFMLVPRIWARESLPFTLVPRIWARGEFFQTVSDWESSQHLLKSVTELGFVFHRSEAGQARIDALFSPSFLFSFLVVRWG